jgi:hypothetical protein
VNKTIIYLVLTGMKESLIFFPTRAAGAGGVVDYGVCLLAAARFDPAKASRVCMTGDWCRGAGWEEAPPGGFVVFNA